MGVTFHNKYSIHKLVPMINTKQNVMNNSFSIKKKITMIYANRIYYRYVL